MAGKGGIRFGEAELEATIREDMAASAAPKTKEPPPLLSEARAIQIEKILQDDCKMTKGQAQDHVDGINGFVGRYNMDPEMFLQEILEEAKVSDDVKQTAGQAIFDSINEALAERRQAAAPALQDSAPSAPTTPKAAPMMAKP